MKCGSLKGILNNSCEFYRKIMRMKSVYFGLIYPKVALKHCKLIFYLGHNHTSLRGHHAKRTIITIIISYTKFTWFGFYFKLVKIFYFELIAKGITMINGLFSHNYHLYRKIIRI